MPDDATDDKTARKWRPTVRHATAYMFVPKDVIYNETALLHGLDQADEAPAIVETMPYFLRVVSEDSVLQERRLRDLRKQLERAERQQRVRQAAGSDYKNTPCVCCMMQAEVACATRLPKSPPKKNWRASSNVFSALPAEPVRTRMRANSASCTTLVVVC